jgi:Flp pilus assembly protein TadG
MSGPGLGLGRLLGSVRRFARARQGAAAVEFALILPIMLSMYLGSIELSSVFTVDQRVINIAGTVGDLVARADASIDSTTLNDYFQAAQAIIAPYSTTGLKQVISVVSVNASNVTKVEWSKGYNGGSAMTVGNPYGGSHPIPDAMLSISHSSGYIIVSEASYSYTPVLGLFFKQPFTLYHQDFYLPRYPGNITCTGC